MNKNKNNNFLNYLKEYLPTIVISLFVVVFVCLCVEFELMYRTQKVINFEQFSDESLNKFYSLEQLEKKLKENPNDVLLNIKLAKVYESINQFDEANDCYKAALKLSHSSNFSLYSYAIFCAKHNLFATAANLAEEMSGNTRLSNFYKAKIYELLAIKFDEIQNIEASVKAYQIAYKYVSSLKNRKYKNNVKEKYSKEYIKLADYNIEKGDTLNAISNLQNSIEIESSALANYKLGLIYLPNNKYLAEKYIHKAFNKDIFIVNPLIYSKLLNDLIVDANIIKEKNIVNFYSLRLDRFKTKLSKTYLFKNQVIISDSKLMNYKKIFNKTRYFLVFDVKNNTKNPVNSLFVKAEININGKCINLQKKIFTKTNPIDAFELKNKCYIEFMPDFVYSKEFENSDILIKYYAKRIDDAPWTLIKYDFLNI